jgi:hypothetical protein
LVYLYVYSASYNINDSSFSGGRRHRRKGLSYSSLLAGVSGRLLKHGVDEGGRGNEVSQTSAGKNAERMLH